MSNEDRLLEEKEIIKLEKTVLRTMGEEYIAEVRMLSKEQLEYKLLSLAKHLQEIITTQNNDEALTQAKDKKTELEAPYREQKKGNASISRFISLLLKDKFE